MSKRIRQKGAVLAVSLIILLVLTLVVVSGSRTVLLQERMTSAVRDSTVSLQLAESGVKEAEAYIETLISTNVFNSTGHLFGKSEGPVNVFEANWGSMQTVNVAGGTAEYYIELLGDIKAPDMVGGEIAHYGQTSGAGQATGFKIVSRGVGDSGNAERIVVSQYGKQF
ncbi:MAG: PilX N-terminal domain-containing pilus assembly protein [Cellvibrionaceae bacterium]